MPASTTTATNQPMHFPNGIKYDLLWQQDYMKIFYSAEGNFLKLVWNGLPSKEQIKVGSEQILVYVKQYNISKIINDVAKVEGLFTESVEWIITNFAPRMNALGVHHVAWIYSEESISRFSADSVLSRSVTDTIAIVFDNIENAERWILAV
ncbi:hypothetical protein I5M27_03655 [Adhaeribacter sp. BT258]|uniref:STAS/SEC14 domain-containing protein n=1 Tax=Adhaeribacter terrigena TaxID=2793070 RepID=A0ABS1C0L5_9BACT|nr:hypothetical protein [Adhaeribacter terrigena]MBK0402065.1 hypothetical protein [Adhaeribacter terrigena]